MTEPTVQELAEKVRGCLATGSVAVPALDALAARCEQAERDTNSWELVAENFKVAHRAERDRADQAERERDEAQGERDGWRREVPIVSKQLEEGWMARAEAAEAEAKRLREALTVYEAATSWGIQRDDKRFPAAVWIGPGATETPYPNPMLVARAALGSGDE